MKKLWLILPLVSLLSSRRPIKRWQSIRIHQISELEQLKLLHYYFIKRTNSWEFIIYFGNHWRDSVQKSCLFKNRSTLVVFLAEMSVVQVHLYANGKTTYWKEIEVMKTAFSFNCYVFAVLITCEHVAPTVSSFSHAISLLTPFNSGMLYYFLLPLFHNSV